MRPIRVALDPDVRSILRLGFVRAEPVCVGPPAEPLRREIAALCAGLVGRHGGRAPGEIPGLAPARELYRAFGIDPTKTRPSSEALVRRVLRGLDFPEISNAVDLGNYCSVRFLVPIGLFDADRIEGDVRLRRGAAGESYPGIRKDDVHLGGRPVLADARGPFGNPTSDSARTAVSPATRSLWMTLFALRSAPPDSLERDVHTAAELIARHLGGTDPVLTASGIAE